MHACILIWDAHTRIGHNIVPYAYGMSVRVWANIRIWAEQINEMEALDPSIYYIMTTFEFGNLWRLSVCSSRRLLSHPSMFTSVFYFCDC